MYDKIIEQYDNLADQGRYKEGADLIADAIGLKMQIISSEYKLHFADDKQRRYVFKIKLIKGGKQYTFNFGQSLSEGNNEPSLYSVLTCLTKYDPGTFEEFVDNYGYDYYSQKVYKAVVKEFNNMQRLFTSDELELLAIVS